MSVHRIDADENDSQVAQAVEEPMQLRLVDELSGERGVLASRGKL